MAKIDIDLVINALNIAGVEGESRKTFLEKLEMLVEEEKAEKEPKTKRRKNEHVIVIKGEGIDPDKLVGAVFTIPQDADPLTLLDSIRAAAVDQNQAKKKSSKKSDIKTFTDSLLVKAKHQKERNYKGLTKEYVRVLAISPEEDDTFLLPKLVKG